MIFKNHKKAITKKFDMLEEMLKDGFGNITEGEVEDESDRTVDVRNSDDDDTGRMQRFGEDAGPDR